MHIFNLFGSIEEKKKYIVEIVLAADMAEIAR